MNYRITIMKIDTDRIENVLAFTAISLMTSKTGTELNLMYLNLIPPTSICLYKNQLNYYKTQNSTKRKEKTSLKSIS